MTADDYAVIGGLFLAAFASGYVTGLLMTAVKSVIEKATGIGS